MSDLCQLDRIEAKLDRIIGGPPSPIVGCKELMRLTGCGSDSALRRLLPVLGIRPYVKGKYRRAEVENAIARKAFNDRMKESQKS